MSMTMLQIINQAQRELGLPVSTLVAAASDPQALQLLAIANSHGTALMKRHDWTVLQTLATITTVNGTSDYSVETDFDRFIDDTQWDRTNAWRLVGPISPQVDRFRRESLGATIGPRRTIRLIGRTVRVHPTPTADGETLAYEYISNKWAQTTGGGATKSSFTADSDVSLLDDNLLIYGIKYRWRHAKGLEAETFKEEFDDYFDLCKAGDIGTGTISMGGEPDPQFLTLDNIPDTGFGG